jgi:hypothetical protein
VAGLRPAAARGGGGLPRPARCSSGSSVPGRSPNACERRRTRNARRGRCSSPSWAARSSWGGFPWPCATTSAAGATGGARSGWARSSSPATCCSGPSRRTSWPAPRGSASS